MINIEKNCGIFAYGDSITAGQSASPVGLSYINLIANLVGGGVSNQAVSGQGMSTAANRAIQTPINRTKLVTVMAGLNDARRLGLGSKDKILANLRALICANILTANTPASALTRTGSWSNLSNTVKTRALGIGGSAIYTNQPAATLIYSFTGQYVVIGSVTNKLTTSYYGDFEYKIDGGDWITFVNNQLTDEAYNNNAHLIDALTDGAHTLTIRPKDLASWTVVDYVGIPDLNAKPIFVAHIPYLGNWTYNGLTINSTIIDELNAEIDLLAETYPIEVIRTNDFYDVATGCSSDGVHPNNTGHNQIANAFKSEISLYEKAIIPSWASIVEINDNGNISLLNSATTTIKYKS